MIFFGRDTEVKETVAFLVKGEHVVLLGPGGIGKSSIAKAVLHNAEVSATYGTQRYFVEFDVPPPPIDHATFLERIARALGVSARRNKVMAHLNSKRVVLAFDDAEAFLDLLDADSATCIAKTMTDIGSLPNVQLLLTTRSRNIPTNLHHNTMYIGGLGLPATREAFSSVYTLEPLGENVISLLAELDYHPLSVNLLAHAGMKNGWSIKTLLRKWSSKKTDMLKSGSGKSENLAAAIELSLNSPIFSNITVAAHTLMRAISFLPKGIHRSELGGLFPRLSPTDAEDIADALVQCSLAKWDELDERLYVLVPIIRAYVNDRYNKDLNYKDPLVMSIREYQYRGLTKNPETWIQREGDNIERLLLFDFSCHQLQTDYGALLKTLGFTEQFLDALYTYHPRVTSILSSLTLPHEIRPVIEAVGFKLGTRQSRSLSLAKAKCLVNICWLEYRRNSYDEAFRASELAIAFCRTLVPKTNEQLASCLRLQGILHQSRGDLKNADQALSEGLDITCATKNALSQAKFHDALSRVALSRGELAQASDLAALAQQYFESNGQPLNLISLLVHRADVAIHLKDFNIARQFAEKAMELNGGPDWSKRHLQIVMLKVDIEGWSGNIPEALKLLDAVLAAINIPSESPRFDDFLKVIQAKASYEAWSGNFESAHTLLERATDTASETGVVHASNLLVSAYIDLFAGEVQTAKTQIQALLESDDAEHKRWSAGLCRALGEISLLDEDRAQSAFYFGKAAGLCDVMEIPPSFLYVGNSHWRTLPDRYVGWTNFLSEHST